MSGDVMGRDIILLHGIFNGIAVMNKEGDAVCVTPIGANADVRSVAENHNVTCGLGSVVANCLARNCPTIQEFVGVQDQFGQVGPQDFLMDEYGLRAANIVAAVKKAIARK